LDGGRPAGGVIEPQGWARRPRGRDVEPMLTDAGSATAALDWIVPQDALDRIGGMAPPRSSLIITDER
jgi:hypothetical protein